MNTEYKIHPTNQFINTPEQILHIGNTYLYKEGEFETTVELVEVKRNPTSWDFTINHKVDKYNKDKELETVQEEIDISFSISVINSEHDGNWQISELT